MTDLRSIFILSSAFTSGSSSGIFRIGMMNGFPEWRLHFFILLHSAVESTNFITVSPFSETLKLPQVYLNNRKVRIRYHNKLDQPFVTIHEKTCDVGTRYEYNLYTVCVNDTKCTFNIEIDNVHIKQHEITGRNMAYQDMTMKISNQANSTVYFLSYQSEPKMCKYNHFSYNRPYDVKPKVDRLQCDPENLVFCHTYSPDTYAVKLLGGQDY